MPFNLQKINMLQINQSAPNFTLHSSTRDVNVTLSDLKGKNVLLLFFPLAFTGVCTKELCSVRDNISFYNNLNATVLGISVDSPATLNKFKEEQNINFTLLSDFNKEASTAYHCIYDIFFGWMKGVSKRAAFVIDKFGVVQYAEVLENADEIPNFESIKNILEKLV